MTIKILTPKQLSNFDTEYVTGRLWDIVKICIDHDFSDRPFTFLDIGGGNGLFADRVLANYPNSCGTIIDNSEFLLSKNKPCENKDTIYGSAENILTLFSYKKFDLIFMNWILHHLVDDSYSKTTENVKTLLRDISQILNSDGKISILENMYDGWAFDNLPGHMIYHLTRAKTLEQFVRILGANTAGTGVCFRSKKAWLKLIENEGMRTLRYSDYDKWRVPFYRKLLLHFGNIRVGHIWAARTDYA